MLRQAAFKGLREDKDPREIVREEALADPPAQSVAGAADPSVRLTHPDRVLWPEAGITKQGLADYYAAVWPFMERHVTGRPLALVRCPAGIGQGCFFQKHEWKGMDSPCEAHRRPAREGEDRRHRRSRRPHRPRPGERPRNPSLGRAPRRSRSSRPADLRSRSRPGVASPISPPPPAWSANGSTAEGLESFVKTTGGKGLHVVAPIAPAADWEAAQNPSARVIAEAMARDDPDRFTASMTKGRRGGRIYVDYLRNVRGATAVCAYSTRAWPKAGVATPVALGRTRRPAVRRPFHARPISASAWPVSRPIPGRISSRSASIFRQRRRGPAKAAPSRARERE